MKIFETDEKINFVDKNNVFVGFDNEQNCCESFGWVLDVASKNIKVKDRKPEDIIKNFWFDPKYILENIVCEDDEDDDEENYYGVQFKLINKSNEIIYLILYNSHNGYYAHGFEFGKKDENGIIYFKEGSL